MSTFTDTAGRDWLIVIEDARTVERIREACDPDFLKNDSNENNTFSRLEADPVLLIGVIYLLCEKQRQERNIDQATFYKSVVGESIDAAATALLEAMLAFCPRSTRNLLEVLIKQKKLQQQMITRILGTVNDEDLTAELQQKLDELLGRPTSSSSAESTPDSAESPPSD